MKYKCIVIDHDDTVVDSTATIHFPCFLEYLRKNMPGKEKEYTLSEYFLKNFHPGVEALFLEELRLSSEQFAQEQSFWWEYVKHHIPTVYPGIAQILWKFKKQGGIIAVCSHSYTEYILRDYASNLLPMPNSVYSWNMPPENRKPSPYTVFDVMEKYNLSQKEILVIDDSKPGFDMAKAAGVDFCAVCWAYDVPEIESFMRRHCTYFCKTVPELKALLFSR